MKTTVTISNQQNATVETVQDTKLYILPKRQAFEEDNLTTAGEYNSERLRDEIAAGLIGLMAGSVIAGLMIASHKFTNKAETPVAEAA